MERVRRVVEAYRAGTRAAGGQRSIACLKRSLLARGVIGSDAVANGTPALARPDAERFDAMFAEVQELAHELLVPTWVTHDPPRVPPAPTS
jgi:hypothetical protein